MTAWELVACAEGVRRANGGEERLAAPSGDELDQLIRKAAANGESRP